MATPTLRASGLFLRAVAAQAGIRSGTKATGTCFAPGGVAAFGGCSGSFESAGTPGAFDLAMPCCWIALITHFVLTGPSARAQEVRDFKAPPHNYWEQEPKDAATALVGKIASGEARLDSSGEKAFVKSVLDALEVPASSQLLVYSATSMQSERINPRNPRALYFNEHVYVGVVPDGRVEVMGVDPRLGGVFYIFDAPKPGAQPRAERSTRCFNCHAGNATQRVPGFVIESVAPINSGASYESYRREENGLGHHVPLAIRFGGWHVTSGKSFGETKANLFASSGGGGVRIVKVMPGEMWDISKHLLPTSDILAHLVHEHQTGFDNRAFQAAYLIREVEAKGASATAEDLARLDAKARELAAYMLFANEAKLPAGGIAGDPQFAADFSKNKRAAKSGLSLKDFDLKSRMFRHRCSYMIYTPQWQELPASFKSKVYAEMKMALSGKMREFAYLPAAERIAIVGILRETLPDLPADWR